VTDEGDVSLLSIPVQELLDAVAARTSAPGGGASAALVTSLAAALTAMAGRFVDPGHARAADIAAVVDRAEVLRHVAAPLADADAAAYGRYLDAARSPAGDDPEARRGAIRAALSAATDIPLQVAETAAEIAQLAAGLVRDGNANLRGDAAAATLLASAGATTAAILVAENAGHWTQDDRQARAVAASDAARTAAATVGEAFGGSRPA
jgi:formiminotetrahydrofolate cyclodeaminase